MSEWISVKNRRPETTGIYFVYMPNNAERQYDTDVYIEPQHTWACNQTYITHWMPIPTLSESEDAENGCMKEASEGEWIIHFDDLFPEESTQECSICHAEQYLRYGDDDNYCPNCGAKMKQVEKG